MRTALIVALLLAAAACSNVPSAREIADELAWAYCGHLHCGDAERRQCFLAEAHALCSERCVYTGRGDEVIARCEPGACRGNYRGDVVAAEACIDDLEGAPAQCAPDGSIIGQPTPSACDASVFDLENFNQLTVTP